MLAFVSTFYSDTPTRVISHSIYIIVWFHINTCPKQDLNLGPIAIFLLEFELWAQTTQPSRLDVFLLRYIFPASFFKHIFVPAKFFAAVVLPATQKVGHPWSIFRLTIFTSFVWSKSVAIILLYLPLVQTGPDGRLG